MSNQQNIKLSAKESKLYREIISNYGRQQFRKGVKLADKLLATVPNHSDTMAMKSLLLHFIGDKEEPKQLLEKASKINPNSHLVWQVYGLIERDLHHYESSIRYMKLSLSIHPKNETILTLLVNIYVQIRSFDPCIPYVKSLIELVPNNLAYYVTLIILYYLMGQYDESLNSLEICKGQIKNNKEIVLNQDHKNELSFLESKILEKCQQYDKSLEVIKNNFNEIFDKSLAEQTMGRIYLKLKQYNHSLEIYKHLLTECSSNMIYHCGLQMSLLSLPFDSDSLQLLPSRTSLSKEQKKILFDYYISYIGDINYLRIVLDVTEEELCKKYLLDYIIYYLRKQSLNLINEIKKLIDKSIEYKTICSSLINEIETLINTSKPIPMSTDEFNDGIKTAFYIFAYNFYYHIKDMDLAMKYLLITDYLYQSNNDLLLFKAKMLKQQNKIDEAINILNIAWKNDNSDRYINNKLAKYYLRTNQLSLACETMSFFTKKSIDCRRDVQYLQIIWFELEYANSCYRCNNFVEASKWYRRIIDHYYEFIYDLYPYFNFSFRKNTFITFIEVINNIDKMYNHKTFISAVDGYIKCLYEIKKSPLPPIPRYKKNKKVKPINTKDVELKLIPEDNDLDGLIFAWSINDVEAEINKIFLTIYDYTTNVDLLLFYYKFSKETNKLIRCQMIIIKLLKYHKDHPQVMTYLDELLDTPLDSIKDSVTLTLFKEFIVKYQGLLD